MQEYYTGQHMTQNSPPQKLIVGLNIGETLVLPHTEKYHLNKVSIPFNKCQTVTTFFRYLQLRHNFNTDIVSKEKQPLVQIFINACKGKLTKQISMTYSILQTERKLSTTYIKLRWEKEAGINPSEEDWSKICKTTATTSSSDPWREFTWKQNSEVFLITPKIKELHKLQQATSIFLENVLKSPPTGQKWSKEPSR